MRKVMVCLFALIFFANSVKAAQATPEVSTDQPLPDSFKKAGFIPRGRDLAAELRAGMEAQATQETSTDQPLSVSFEAAGFTPRLPAHAAELRAGREAQAKQEVPADQPLPEWINREIAERIARSAEAARKQAEAAELLYHVRVGDVSIAVPCPDGFSLVDKNTNELRPADFTFRNKTITSYPRCEIRAFAVDRFPASILVSFIRSIRQEADGEWHVLGSGMFRAGDKTSIISFSFEDERSLSYGVQRNFNPDNAPGQTTIYRAEHLCAINGIVVELSVVTREYPNAYDMSIASAIMSTWRDAILAANKK